MQRLHLLTRWALDQWARLGTLLKVVSAVSAIIGLVLSGAALYRLVADHFAGRAAKSEFVAAADAHLDGRNYKMAWDANARALQIGPTDAEAVAQQIRIAMRWLQNARLSSDAGPKTFGELVAPLEEVLVRRRRWAKGVELADIEAHIGLARFLRSRDGVRDLEIERQFDAALASDPQNVYGHVLKGFWLLWSDQAISEARPHLDAALGSRTDPAYVDSMILTGWLNRSSDEYQFGAVEYANKIRKLGRDVDDGRSKERLLGIYEDGIRDPRHLARIAGIMPADEHVATLAWILQGKFNDDRRRNGDALRAYFLELAGNRAEAGRIYESVVATAPPFGGRVKTFAQAGLDRLRK